MFNIFVRCVLTTVTVVLMLAGLTTIISMMFPTIPVAVAFLISAGIAYCMDDIIALVKAEVYCH